MKQIFLVLVLIFVSCNGQKKAAIENNVESENLESKTTPLIVLLRDNYSGADTEETIVVRDYKRLKSFFSKINRTRKPGLPVPVVDFSKEIILIFCSGAQRDDSLRDLTLIEENDTEIIFGTKDVINQNSAGSTASISPFCVYKMPVTDKEIIFQ